MKKTFTFLAFVMLLSLSCFAQIEKGWRVTVKVHLPKGDTSEAFVFTTLAINFSRIDTIRAEKVKGNTYYFNLPNKSMRYFLATSDKYEPEVVFVDPEKGDYVDLYLKTPRKEPVKSQKEETAKLLQIMKEMFPFPEIMGDEADKYDNRVIEN